MSMLKPEINKIPTRVFVVRITILLLLWWLLTNGDRQSLWLGIPVVLVLTLASGKLSTTLPATINWLELIRFIPFFLKYSITGAWDVARRTLHPRMPLSPDTVEYPLRIPEGQAQVFLVSVINLLPGTLVSNINDNLLKVHILDRQKEFYTELATVELHVARLFGLTIHSDSTGNQNEQI